MMSPWGCRDWLRLFSAFGSFTARLRGGAGFVSSWLGASFWTGEAPGESFAQGAFRGDHMQNRYRRLLLVVNVLLWVVVGVAGHALALAPTCIEFQIPTTDSVPTGITAGPDGALWFSEEFKNKIGRITTDGVITEYPIPTPDSNPGDITTGPDGGLWFIEQSGFGNQIGRITTDGVITEFPVPTPFRDLGKITTGPDGALWFTHRSTTISRIGTTATARGITDFPPPAPSTCPTDIAPRPGGDGA